MDRKENGQGKLPMWQERLRKNSAAMREEFERMDKRTALYNGTREIDKTPDAKSSKAAARLSEQMKTGDFEKKYSAVLVGSPKEKRATLTDYLKKNPVNNMVYVCGQSVDGAKFAELEYEVKEEKNGLAFALVTLHTGRSHQIRVQMSHMGTPVYGDMRYGGDKAKKGRLALWATTLAFTHPVSKQRLCFKVEPPKDELPWKYFDTSVVVDPYEAL